MLWLRRTEVKEEPKSEMKLEVKQELMEECSAPGDSHAPPALLRRVGHVASGPQLSAAGEGHSGVECVREGVDEWINLISLG